MFKRSQFIIFGSLTLMSSTALLFQNCSANFAAVDKQKQLSSLSIDIDELEVPVAVEKSETSFQPVLADRYYLKSLLESVFGPSASNVDTAKNLTDFQINGSPCNFYEDHSQSKDSRGAKVRAVAMEACALNSSNRLSSQTNPLPTVTRQAKIVRACSDLTTNATTSSFAFKKISSKSIPEATEANIKTAFELFYRNNSDPDQGVLDSLRMMLTADAPTADEWRTVLYTICISPQWQVL